MADSTFVTDDPVITSKDQLIENLAAGSKPKADWRIGAEHEKFVYDRATLEPIAYENEPGIKDVLDAFEAYGWKPKYEGPNIIALTQGKASVTLEPGGQLELSGAPLENIHEICGEVGSHLRQAKEIGERLNIGFLGLGFHPTKRREEIPVMPKARYRIMRNYMPKVGSLGLDMMMRTCTVQVNLDFSSEADMVKKFRVALALQPLATVLFANSPFTEGRPNGFVSYRSHVWTDTDADRTGMLPFVFEDGFGFERYVDYMLDVPMYFVERDGVMSDVAGRSFRDFMAGKLRGFERQAPTIKDWNDHLTTTFPEVRLKTFLEMRGADSGPWSRLCALPALWVGLLYDTTALDAAWDMVKDWSLAEMEMLRREVPSVGLKAVIGKSTVQELSREMLRIADIGLANRQRLDSAGQTEQGFLSELWDIVETGMTPADRLLERYQNDWGGDITHVFKEVSY